MVAFPQPVVGVDGRKYLPFFSSKCCFSNFFPQKFTQDGVEYSSSEQYFQHQKALTFGDHQTAAWIMLTDKPKEARYLGRRVHGFDPVVWEQKSMDVMYKGVRAKFIESDYLEFTLIAYHKDAIPVECNPSDHLWSCGLKIDDPRVLDPKQWLGLNRLGQVIMKVRKELDEFWIDAMSGAPY